MVTVPPIVLILTGSLPKVFVNDLLSFSPKGSFNAVLKAFTPEFPLKVAILSYVSLSLSDGDLSNTKYP